MFILRSLKYLLVCMIGSILLFLVCSCSNEAPLDNIINEHRVESNVDEKNENTNKQKVEATIDKDNQVDIEDKSPIEDELIGIWHAGASIGAGYSDLFYFYPNNEFKLAYAQGDEAKRVLDISGNWAISEEQLILSITQKTVVEGGELVDASPSATSKYRIENGIIVKRVLDTPEIERYTLGEIQQATDSPYEKKIVIDTAPYWKVSEDPEDKNYIQQSTISENTKDDLDKNIEGMKDEEAMEQKIYQESLGEWEISDVIQVAQYSVISSEELIGKTIKLEEDYFINEKGEKRETNIRVFKSDSMELKVAEMIEVDDNSSVYIINIYQGEEYLVAMYYVNGGFWIKLEGHIYRLVR